MVSLGEIQLQATEKRIDALCGGKERRIGKRLRRVCVSKSLLSLCHKFWV